MFEHLKHLIQTKNKLKQDLVMDASFTPFMAQRWLSMHSAEYCVCINDSCNRLYQALSDKNHLYMLLQTLVPCNSYRFIKYIKKQKTTKSINDKYIEFVANSMETSKREAEQFLICNPDTLKQLKKVLGE